MAWHMQRHCLECANLEPLTVAEKVVELASIPGEIAAGIEYLPEHLLNAEDLRRTECEAIDIGALERYARPLPVMQEYDQLLASRGAR